MSTAPDSSPRMVWDLARQREAILGWLARPEARAWCLRCSRKFGLPSDMADDVLSSAYIRLSSALERRIVPFENMSDESGAVRYAARACENAAIDFGRVARRRNEVPVVSDEIELDIQPVAFTTLSEGKLALEDLRRLVVQLARDGASCSGCPDEVVLATALYVINSQLIGESVGLSDLLYEALEAVDPDFPGGRGDAARQRKKRCGDCVLRLLRRAVELSGEVRP